MGTLNGKESTMTGTLNATWEGDQWKQGSGATWLGGTYDPETDTIFMGTGNPGAVELVDAQGRQPATASTLAINPDNGEIRVAPANHAA